MKKSSSAYINLCKQLKKMGYSGSLDDPRNIKRFMSLFSDHASYPKAILHWNELVNSSFVWNEKPSDRLRSVSSLDTSIKEGKRHY